MPTERFKSPEAYRKNLAYRHMHGIPFTAKRVVVAGKAHEVKHSKTGERAEIDAKQRKKVVRRKTMKRGLNQTRRGNQHFESETYSYHY